jgi:hypothetical protein
MYAWSGTTWIVFTSASAITSIVAGDGLDGGGSGGSVTLDVDSTVLRTTVVNAKGDLVTASANDTPAILTAASTNGYILAVNSATTTGLEWVVNEVGDITAVTSGTGISITDGTGPVPIVALTIPVTESSGGTNQTSYATGDLLYASASNTLSKRTIGTSGQILTVTGGVPAWENPTTVDTQSIEVMTLMGAYI